MKNGKKARIRIKRNSNGYEKIEEIQNHTDPLKPRVKIYRKKEKEEKKVIETIKKVEKPKPKKIKTKPKKEEKQDSEYIEKEELTEWEPVDEKQEEVIEEQNEEPKPEPIFLPVEEESIEEPKIEKKPVKEEPEIEKKTKEPEKLESIVAGEGEYKKVLTVLNYTLKRRVKPKKEDLEKKKEEELQKQKKIRKQQINILKELKSVDEKTAVLLYDHGIANIEALKEATLYDLTRIRGINKGKAKKILKEVEEPELVLPPVKKIKRRKKQEEAPGEVHFKQNGHKETKEELEKQEIQRQHKIEVFKEIKSVDEKTAVLLYDEGITNVDALKEATLYDLTRIKIHKRRAKKIIEEIEAKEKEFKPKPIKMGESSNGKVVKKQKKKEELEPKHKDKSTSTVEFKAETAKWEPVKNEDIEESESTETDYTIEEINEEFVEPYNEENSQFSRYIADEDFEKSDAGLIDEKIANQKNGIDYEKIFEGLTSIDTNTAKLLYKNGVKSIDILRNMSVGEIAKINGINKKHAKQIKQELNGIHFKKDEFSERKIISDEDEISEWVSYDDNKNNDIDHQNNGNGYSHGEYTLYERTAEDEGNGNNTIRFFSKNKPHDGKAIDLPKGYEVKVNHKTGIPYLSKKK